MLVLGRRGGGEGGGAFHESGDGSDPFSFRRCACFQHVVQQYRVCVYVCKCVKTHPCHHRVWFAADQLVRSLDVLTLWCTVHVAYCLAIVLCWLCSGGRGGGRIRLAPPTAKGSLILRIQYVQL